MNHDVIGQLVSDMRGFLDDSAFAHVRAATLHMEASAKPQAVVLPFPRLTVGHQARGVRVLVSWQPQRAA